MNNISRLSFVFVLSVFLTLPANAAVTAWFDLKVENGNLMLPTEVAGVPGYSIIDTGSEITAINSGFIEANGLEFDTGRKVKVKGEYGQQNRGTYRNIPGVVFGSSVTFTNAVDLDLGAPETQLLLGASFFKNYIFQFDYTNERMRLITRDEVDLKKIKNVESKRDHDNNYVVIKVGLNNDDVAWLLMDTGSNGGLLVERSQAEIFDWIGTYPTTKGISKGMVREREMEYFKIPSLDIGPFNIENVQVSMPAEGQHLEFFEEEEEIGTRFTKRNLAQGLLGFDVLKHFVVTIDYERGHVHFYPGEKVAED